MNVQTRNLLAESGFVLKGSSLHNQFLYEREDGIMIIVGRNQDLDKEALNDLIEKQTDT